MAQGAVVAGCETIVAVAVDDERLARAAELDATATINSTGIDVPSRAAPASIGVALPGMQLRVADPDSGPRELAAGQVGETQARGRWSCWGTAGVPRRSPRSCAQTAGCAPATA